MTLFSVECITCRRRLKVNHADAIGQILACPGCGSMVEIVPPPDWQAATGDAAADGASTGSQTQWAESEAEQAEIAAGQAETVDDFDSLLAGGTPDDPLPPPLLRPTAPPLEGAASEPPSPHAAWSSPVEQQWRKRILLGGCAVGLLALVTGLAIFAFSEGDDPPKESQTSAEQNGDSSQGEPEASPAATAEKKPDDHPTETDPPTPVDPPNTIGPPSPVDPPEVTPMPTEGPAEPPPVNPDPRPDENPVEPPDPSSPNETEEPVIESPPTPPANPIDVEARLADKIPQINLPRIGLREFLEFLTDLSTVSITLDLDALAELRVDLDTPLSVAASDSTVGDVLRKALAPLKLDYVLRGGQVVVTHAAANRRPRTVPHFVGDLATDPASRRALAELLKKMIEPQSWDGEKPTGTIVIGDEQLTVTHSFSTHYKILRLLERLRIARRLQPRNKYYDARAFELTTPMTRATDRLDAPLPANFHQRPLREIVAYVNRKSELQIVVDWHALGKVGVWPDTLAKLRAQQTLAALGEMLTRLRLALRVVDERTVQITSMAALRSRYDVQLYRIDDLLPGAEAAAPLIENIKGRVAPQTWQSAGGSGTMHYDPKSGYLIVRQTQGVQNLLETTFQGLRKEPR